MSRLMPKQLAKTIIYICYVAPGEHGLFWNPDGTMPWKELYWVLQEDPELRFVREPHIKELLWLGMELPFTLDGKRLRLREKFELPVHPVVEPPERLFGGISHRSYKYTMEHGLTPAGRPFLPLAAQPELAELMAARRDPKPILCQVRALDAHLAGISFHAAGTSLYLVDGIPNTYLIAPPVREEILSSVARERNKSVRSLAPALPVHAGSFFVAAGQLSGSSGSAKEATAKEKGKSKKGPGWKKEARDSRGKRIP
jgi:putative RNA 2'-phosphotransferase